MLYLYEHLLTYAIENGRRLRIQRKVDHLSSLNEVVVCKVELEVLSTSNQRFHRVGKALWRDSSVSVVNGLL